MMQINTIATPQAMLCPGNCTRGSMVMEQTSFTMQHIFFSTWDAMNRLPSECKVTAFNDAKSWQHLIAGLQSFFQNVLHLKRLSFIYVIVDGLRG